MPVILVTAAKLIIQPHYVNHVMVVSSVMQLVKVVLVVRREIVQIVMSVILPVIIILPLTLR